jgi:1,4-alpha-glucan branching enzyme
LESWRRGLNYKELAEQLTEYVKETGFTHVEFLPVAQHPFSGSWGYQVTGYFAPNSRFGNPDEFRFLVDALHQAGIGCIMDWVPAHFPKDEWALGRFDGTPLYEDGNPQRGEHPDWGTYIFNFGRSEVRNFLVANATYWMEEFHLDGLRVDAVASMLYLDYSRNDGEWSPNIYGGNENLEAIDLLKEVCATSYKRNPGTVMIAEESTAYQGVTAPTNWGGLGFGFKWNMGWMHDTLDYLAKEPIWRQYHHNEITFSMVYQYSENYVMPLSHDEVVHGKGSLIQKMPGDLWQKLANVRALFVYQWTHPGKMLIFQGLEFAQWKEWEADYSIDWGAFQDSGHVGVYKLLKDLNVLYKNTKPLYELDEHPEGFEWLDSMDYSHNVLSYMRKDSDGNPVVAVINFAGGPHDNYRIPLPQGGTWREVLNSDDLKYGGSGVTNSKITALDEPMYGRPYSASITVPPLAGIILKPVVE